MHIGKKFKIHQVLLWTRRELFLFVIIATIPTALYQLFGWTWLSIPWLPVALVGTAVAFLIGFKNNASYGRLWEARKIWGAIVNDSRTWGVMSRDFIINVAANDSVTEHELTAIHKRLVYRHFAWLTTLRFQLRQTKGWENMDKSHAKEYRQRYSVPEWESELGEEIKHFLSDEDYTYVMKKKNKATQILSLQSMDLKDLRNSGLIDAYPYVELENIIKEFYTHQGKCERIKNFPYPRQFATFNLYFVWLFIFLVPLGMLHEVGSKLSDAYVWLTIPFTVIVAWVFHTMEKIGEATENPFEGGANDIPMFSLSRTIEIDMREMLEETDLPEAVKPKGDILM